MANEDLEQKRREEYARYLAAQTTPKRRASNFDLQTIEYGAIRDGGGLDTQMVAAWLVIALVEEVRESRLLRDRLAQLLA